MKAKPPRHLRPIRGNWYAVLAIPKALQPHFGKQQFSAACRTSDQKKAERIATKYVSQWRDEIDAALQGQPSPIEARLDSMLSNVLSESAVREWIDSQIDAMERKHAILALHGIREPTKPMERAEVEQALAKYAHLPRPEPEYVEPDPAMLADSLRTMFKNAFRSGLMSDTDRAELTQTIWNPHTPDRPCKTTPFDAHLEAWQAVTHHQPKYKNGVVSEVRRFASMCPEPIETLSGKHVQAWIEEMLKGLAVVTVKASVIKLNAYWKWLMQHEYVKSNPFEKRSIKDGRKPKERRMSKRLGFTNAEIQRLLNAIQDEALRNLFLIAIYTGARRESIVTLRTEDIVPVRRISCFHFDDKTDAGDRHVPIHTALQPMMTSLCDRAIDGYLFDETARGKNKYSEGDRLGKMFTRLKQGLDFPRNKVFHSTRHGVAERLGELGCPAMTLKDIMGHEKHDTTEDYKKTAKAHVMREWIEKLDYTALDEDP